MQGIQYFFQEMTPGAYGIYGLFFLAIGGIIKWRLDLGKLSLDERVAKREGFTKQVELLLQELKGVREENRLLLKDNHDLREEYNAFRILCHKENEQLRKMIIEVTDDLEGLKRERAQDLIHAIRLKGLGQ